MTQAVTPRPASTVLLLRDGAGGEVEVFMMVRHYEIDFNSGALVFPGGSVDNGDQEIIARPELYSGGEGLDAGSLSFRIAAIRETFEESGILLARPRGSNSLVEPRRAAEIEGRDRAALCESKTTFLKVLSENEVVLALDELVPYAHWITPEGMPKRFDTWFFLAAAPISPRVGATRRRRRNRPALMTVRNPPTPSGFLRAKRWLVVRAAGSSCHSRPRAISSGSANRVA